MKIDKDVPRYPYGTYTQVAKKMEIGDSVFFERRPEALALRHALWRQGFHMSIQREREGWRVWRIEDETIKRENRAQRPHAGEPEPVEKAGGVNASRRKRSSERISSTITGERYQQDRKNRDRKKTAKRKV